MENANISIEKLSLIIEPSIKLINFLQNKFYDINKINWEWEYNSKNKYRLTGLVL